MEQDSHDDFKRKVGKTIVFWGYTSATTDMATLDAFLPDGSGGTLFCIKVAYAAAVSGFSAFPDEAEMIIPAGTVMRVLNVMRRSGNAIIELGAERNLLEPSLFPDHTAGAAGLQVPGPAAAAVPESGDRGRRAVFLDLVPKPIFFIFYSLRRQLLSISNNFAWLNSQFKPCFRMVKGCFPVLILILILAIYLQHVL